MSKKNKLREPKSNNILLADILARLRIFDRRLDRIEGEMAGVKNAVNIFMKISKLVGAIVGIGTLIWKGISMFMPKGRNGKNNSNRKSKKNKSKK